MQSDRDLLEQILQRSAPAFEELMARHLPGVLACIGRIVRDGAEVPDVAQEVFLRVWTRAEQWNGQGTVPGWILRIATNLAINQLRSASRRRWGPPPPPVPPDDDPAAEPAWLVDLQGQTPDEAAQRIERVRLVRQLLSDLPEEKRELLHLVFDADLELREVAEQMGLPLGTVKSRLHYTVKGLKREWDEYRQDLEDSP